MKFKAHLLFCFWCSFTTAQQVTDSTQLKELIMRYWVSGHHDIKSISFVGFGSKEAQELDIQFQFGGTEFLKDNVVRFHRWKMCGNDDGPAYEDGRWYLHKKQNQWYIIIHDQITKFYTGYRERQYKVMSAGADGLVLDLEE